jgi:hypothetical protein
MDFVCGMDAAYYRILEGIRRVGVRVSGVPAGRPAHDAARRKRHSSHSTEKWNICRMKTKHAEQKIEMGIVQLPRKTNEPETENLSHAGDATYVEK